MSKKSPRGWEAKSGQTEPNSNTAITDQDTVFEIEAKETETLDYDRPMLRLVHVDNFESPFSLSSEEFALYARRFVTLFVDEDRSYSGGNGKVIHAENSCGEALALKMCLTDQSEYALRHEYEIQRSLSGVKGIPQVYGWGMLEGSPVIIMEWVEGITLTHACRSLAVDDDGRLSPLTAARIGRDLFDLLSRMDVLEGEFAHRDITPNNILIRTSRLPLLDQSEEGVFDLCLIDFGSAAHYGKEKNTSTKASSGAVPAYAAPELLDSSLDSNAKAKTSPLVDVFAVTSVLYEMACGHLPYQSYLDEARSAAEDTVAEKDIFTCELKTKNSIDRMMMAHRAASDIGSVLSFEPEVAVVASIAASEFSLKPDAGEVREALAMVDEQLEELIEAGLQANPHNRPLASAMRDALATFCFQYADNVGRALRGEPLVSSLSGSPASGFGGSPIRMRNLLRAIGKAASAAVWVVAVVATGILTGGADAAFGFGQNTFTGSLNGIMVSCVLALPGVLGIAVRGKEVHSLKGFIRGSIGLVCGVCIALLANASVAPTSEGISQGLAAALFATTAAAWCPMVVDFALAALPARRRKLLKAAAQRYALKSGKEEQSIEKVESSNQKLNTDQGISSADDIDFEVIEDDLRQDSPENKGKENSHDGK